MQGKLALGRAVDNVSARGESTDATTSESTTRTVRFEPSAAVNLDFSRLSSTAAVTDASVDTAEVLSSPVVHPHFPVFCIWRPPATSFPPFSAGSQGRAPAPGLTEGDWGLGRQV